MKQVNMHAAKTNLSALVKEAAAGDSFAIAINGKPMVKVIPFRDAEPLPRIGFMKGKISVPDNFDTMYEEEISTMFERGAE